MARIVDHIVYAVHNLESAIQQFDHLLGCRPVLGGKHQNQGTKNAVMHLGDQIYLELLTIDHENIEVMPPRWMGIDQLEEPAATRWALKSSDLKHDRSVLKNFDPTLGKIQKGKRELANGELLSWQMILPSNGSQIDLIPFMCDWQNSDVHPTDQMQLACQLLEVKLSHPNPESLQPLFDQLSIEQQIHKSEKPELKILLKCPNGIVEI